ncbi:hypothetical protein C8R46DRAFT_808326, partial [Mycena filopes]
HIPRPPNAFLCFRSNFVRTVREAGGGGQDQRALSVIAAEHWRALGNEERRTFQSQAR